jgi:hypothetical protein
VTDSSSKSRFIGASRQERPLARLVPYIVAACMIAYVIALVCAVVADVAATSNIPGVA